MGTAIANNQASSLEQNALASISEGVVLTNKDQLILYANVAFTQLTGYSQEEIVGRNCNLLQGPGTDHKTRSAIARALTAGETFRGEILNYRKDGRPFWNDLSITPIRNEQGQITHYVGVQRDVTVLKEQERELRIAAEAFEVDEGILVIDPEQRIIRVNRAFCRLSGYAAEELLGHTPAIFQSDRYDQDFYARMWAAILERGFWHGEIWSRRKTGQIQAEWLSLLSIRTVWDSAGDVQNYVAHFRDISENRRIALYNRLLSEINLALSRIEDQEGLLETLCSLAVKHTDIRLAWIGRPKETGWFQLLASAGDVSYLNGIHISVREEIPEGQGPAGCCWREQRSFYDNIFGQDPQMQPWRDRGAQQGFSAVTTIPIFRQGQLWAVAAFYIGQEAEFTPELRKLLEEMCRNLGTGLDRLDDWIREKKLQDFNAILLESLTSGINIMRYPERVVERVNQRMLAIYGARSADEVVGHTAREFYSDEKTFQQVSDFAQSVLERGSGVLRDVPYRRLDGGGVYVDISGQRLPDRPGEPMRIVWTHVDVTERHQAEQRVQELLQAQDALLDNAVAGIDMVQYPERIFTQVNQGFLDILGYSSAKEVVGHSTQEIYPSSESSDRMAQLSQRILQQGSGGLKDLQIVRPDGNIAYADVFGKRIDNGAERPVIVWTSVEVTERHRLMAELMRQSITDVLTGLPNRRALDQELDDAIPRAERLQKQFALCMLDLDGFKPINDTYGHMAGDEVLAAVGKRLPNALRPTDFVARFGGDEFVVLLEYLDRLDELDPLLAKIDAAVRPSIRLSSGETVSVRVSIGVAAYTPGADHTEGTEALLRLADQALYEAKARKGDWARSWVLYGEKTALQRGPFQKLLHNGGLEVWYQPILENQSRRIVGIEALARLRDGDGRVRTPGEFLPHLDRDDLFALNQKVLRQVIADLAALDEMGFSLWASINTDPRSISEGCVQCVQSQILSKGIDPARITLEILEGSDFPRQEIAAEHLQQLKEIGVRLSLDDVGSAYSSLLRIKDLPIDKIKLDQDFVRTLEVDPKGIIFTRSVQEMAIGLGVEMVVEGVETDDILDVMTVLGVKLLQGYAIGKPMAIQALQDFLEHPPNWNREQPFSLLGLYAEHVVHHDYRARALADNPRLMDYVRLADASVCVIHQHLQRLVPQDNHQLIALHDECHRQLVVAGANALSTLKPLDRRGADQASEAFCQAILNLYQERKTKSLRTLEDGQVAQPVGSYAHRSA
ncbi:MAG: PAS domain S-box protein [Acidobacteriaceae bacterium]